MTIILSILAFAIAIIILVFVHEFGHFWVAKKLGVKVLVFSIGFGKVLYKKTIGETDFVLSLIPLGGFVKMLDAREMSVSDNEKHREFTGQSLRNRSLIVVAGPLFNFIFAILAYWLVFVIGITGLPPVVGAVAKDSNAAMAKFQTNDKIVSVNHKPIQLWREVLENISTTAIQQQNIPITVINDLDNQQRKLILNSDGFLQSPRIWMKNLGLSPKIPKFPPMIGETIADYPAALAGLQSGDTILEIDGVDIKSWQQMVEIIQTKAQKTIVIKTQKQNGIITEIMLTPKAQKIGNKTVGHIGVRLNSKLPDELLITADYGLGQSLTKAVVRTWDFSKLTLTMIGKMLTGEVGIKENIGGPISIAKIAGMSFSLGFSDFVAFLAVISISLGVLNLLPIPVLDGGHLLLYLIEFIKGDKLSDAIETGFQKVGMAIIFTLIIFTIYNDINKLI